MPVLLEADAQDSASQEQHVGKEPDEVDLARRKQDRRAIAADDAQDSDQERIEPHRHHSGGDGDESHQGESRKASIR